MARKKTDPTQKATAFFEITLSLGYDLGNKTLEEAMEHAKQLGVTDVLDLSHVEHNDSSIRVTGVFLND